MIFSRHQPPGWSQTQWSTCRCLPSAVIKDVYHLAWLCALLGTFASWNSDIFKASCYSSATLIALATTALNVVVHSFLVTHSYRSKSILSHSDLPFPCHIVTNACRAGDKPVEQLAVENPAQRFRNQCDVRVWNSPPITQPTLPLSMGEYLSSVTVLSFLGGTCVLWVSTYRVFHVAGMMLGLRVKKLTDNTLPTWRHRIVTS